MTSIVRYAQNDIEIYIDTTTHESFTSIRGYARMSGKNPSTISRRLNAVACDDTKTLEVHTAGGLQRVALISEDLIAEWLPNDNPEATRNLLKWGTRGFLHSLAGYKVFDLQTDKPQLPAPDVRVSSLINSLKDIGFELNNPRFNQHLKDLCSDILGLNKKQLASEAQWCGVAERAEELGYPVALVTKQRSQLGKYVKSVGLEFTKEKRLCNGTQRPIHLYKVTQQLDDAIHEYMRRVS